MTFMETVVTSQSKTKLKGLDYNDLYMDEVRQSELLAFRCGKLERQIWFSMILPQITIGHRVVYSVTLLQSPFMLKMRI